MVTFKQIEAIRAKEWEKQRGWIVGVKGIKEDSPAFEAYKAGWDQGFNTLRARLRDLRVIES